MISEADFQDHATESLEDLEDRVIPISEEHEFELESSGGMLTFIFEKPSAAKFIISPNSPARQIWVSALATSFKFDWDDDQDSFVLDKTREPFPKVIADLLSRQLGQNIKL
jgi:iron donor protein CyaY